ncbi:MULTISPECIES: flagellar basal body P-ring formation chaperone FlgA [Marinobacter]|uniref:Flagella basal body P-ring formation protein FlgA n=1 Tax=Marinobacter xiaoshiensis TaxID=3073652 RepID=A0ABU2HG15_9GAMM|nr:MULTISPECIES: flagellar basal body P-ring formation chaperone FlgA [unclassified Marinobacter]MBK1874814.1 flagellar basal body P-ring formation protein FlgA [Marinobacter sp. 1-3A]MBK1887734.1 flagellar basal body P-ring formation protein FlgA [Marinobacter sp. DY40_1A1]MDS1309989.1 flagellar basal body P-ring formation chaperone FlgA [Marinobacter sp. F60267]
MRTQLLVWIMLAATFANQVQARTTADEIREATAAFLETFAATQTERGYKVAFETGNIDNRLALAACSDDLDIEFTGDPWKSEHPSVQIACAGDRPWRMFVTTTVSISGPALVAARPLGRGERVTGNMLETRDVVLNASRRGIITDSQMIEGMIIRRPVNAGSVLTPDLLDAPIAVSRGDHVIITARRGPFSVRSRGKALASASVGEQVLVENLGSARTVKANVTAPGHVEVPM